MKRTQLIVACLFVLSIFMVPCSAFAFLGADVAVGGWQQTPTGNFGYKSVDTLDLKDDLKYDTKTAVMARAKVELPLILPNIYLMYTPMSFDGTGSKNVNFTYGGSNFTQGVPIQSKLTLDHIDLAFFYPIPLLKTATLGKLNAELGLNLRKIDFKGTISQDTLNRTETKEQTIYMPMLYVGVQIKPISLFALEVEARGIGNGDNHYYDYIGRLRINPIPLVFVAAGYRSEDIKIDVSDIKAGIKFSGPFAEVGLSF
jgi:outer membrane protein